MGPCSLLSPDQVEQVYGEDPGEPESIEHEYVALGNSPACFWNEVGAHHAAGAAGFSSAGFLQ